MDHAIKLDEPDEVVVDAEPIDARYALPKHGTTANQVDFAEKRDLHRGLKQRHIQMIALAGTIGTGLFLSSGRAVARGGPLGAL